MKRIRRPKIAISLLIAGSLLLPGATTIASVNPDAYSDDRASLSEEQSDFFEVIESAQFEGLLSLEGESSLNKVPVQLDAGDQIAIKSIIVNELDETERMVEVQVRNRSGKTTTYYVEEAELSKALTSSSVPESQQALRIDQIIGAELAGGGGWVQPVRGKITSRPGPRRNPITKKRGYHYGTDYAVPIGTPISAGGTGKVVSAGTANGYGGFVEILHSGGIVTRYAHLSKVLVGCGQTVSAGSLIAKSGNTGRSTGPHLHYEQRAVRPLNKCGGKVASSAPAKESVKTEEKKSGGGFFESNQAGKKFQESLR